MADFLAQPTHETDVPTIEVHSDPNNPFPLGLHKFQLVVEDTEGNQSAPVVVEVIVRDTTRPTAVLEVKPEKPEFGQSFTLDGSRSTDVAPGKIVKYIWTRLTDRG